MSRPPATAASAAAAAASERRLLRMLLPLALLLLLAAPAARAAEVPGDQPSLAPDKSYVYTGSVTANNDDVYENIQAPAGTNPAIIVTLTPIGGSGDADLYCSRGAGAVPEAGAADFQSEAIGVNQDQVYIPPLDEGEQPAAYSCAVVNPGTSLAPVFYKLSVTFEYNAKALVAEERAVAQQLFDRCCKGGVGSCQDWKLANEDLQQEEAGKRRGKVDKSLVDTDLCSIGGVCDQGRLVQLNANGWFMECPFPGDLLSQFKGLRGLYAGWNSFTGDVNEAAASLASLPDLQELGLFGNSLSGELREGGQVCGLVQAGRLEMLQLGGQTPGGLTGGLPACLFNGASRLYQFSAASNRLAGSLPDAFAGAANLQLLNVASNSLTGVIPRSLADAPALTVLDLSNNSLGGSIPAFKSLKLSGLDLSFNRLGGAVPEELAGHPALHSLDLKANQLTALPAKWSQRTVLGAVQAPLGYLRVSSPLLAGPFPQGLSAYPNLTFVLLGGNQLSGELPDPSEGEWPALRFLDVDDNRLEGRIGEGWAATGIFRLPSLGAAQAYWNTFSAMNNRLSAPVPQPLLGAMSNTTDEVSVFLRGNPEIDAAASGKPLPAPGSPATPSASGGSTTASTGSGDSGGDSGGVNVGAVVGITVGATLALVAAAGAAVVWIKRRDRRALQTSQVTSSSKFERFLEDPLPEGPSQAATFTAASPAPAAGHQPATGGVELSSTRV